MHISEQRIKEFQQKILSWYSENKRDLPWRKMRDPYNILISEVMSQQTQLSRVIPKYETWMKCLPTVQSLASASVTEVLTVWSGLGYNRRALYLQKAAQCVVSKFNGRFPEDETLLKTLPGIGEYTAKAMLCFAFDKQVAVVDTNVRKVIVTQFQISHIKLHISNKALQQIADQLLPVGKAYEWNQALMDYSASVLKKEKIPLPKQSKFKDSDRYYRGQIVKLLVQKKRTTNNELHDHFNKHEQIINHERLTRVIEGLLKDALVKKQEGHIILP